MIKNLMKYPKGKSGYNFPEREINCLICSGTFLATGPNPKYCSTKCKNKVDHIAKVKKFKDKKDFTCKLCNKKFGTPNNGPGRAIYCSNDCAKLEIMATSVGERAYSMKAFIHFDIKCNRCGIEDIEVLCVHHIDHKRSNNDLENLEIVCANCHHRHHYKGIVRYNKIRFIKEFKEKNPKWKYNHV